MWPSRLHCSRSWKASIERVRNFHLNFNYIIFDDRFDILREMSIVTMSVIAKCAFGMTIDNLGEKENPMIAKAGALFSPKENETPLALIMCRTKVLFVLLPKYNWYHYLYSLVDVLPKRMFKWLVAATYDKSPNQRNWKYFEDLMETMMKQREDTAQVFTFHSFIDGERWADRLFVIWSV